MIVWVKEYSNILTLNTIAVLLKKEIDIEPLVTLEQVDTLDIIFISESDTNISNIDFMTYTVMIYEVLLKNIYTNIIEEHHFNFDYYYIKNAMSHATSPSIDTIITGSSYGLFGIDTTMLKHEINLSLPSADLYYSLKGIYKVCQQNKNIRNIVLCCGYYYFFSDLSKTQNLGEIMRISNVYEPLFNDIHNCILLPPKQDNLFQSDICDIQNMLGIYALGEYEKHYFHNDRPRKNFATKLWEDKTKDWIQLSDTEKEAAAQRRASSHNKSKNRNNTLLENESLFNELSIFCKSNNINLLIVITPVTKHYQNSLYPGFKDMFYKVLNETEGLIHLLDLSDDNTYTESDFNDTDHLSNIGAKKMTQTILDVLQELHLQ